MEQYRLEMRGINKTYGNTAALQDVDFCVKPGKYTRLLAKMALENQRC